MPFVAVYGYCPPKSTYCPELRVLQLVVLEFTRSFFSCVCYIAVNEELQHV
jgi:hypothetical protein